MRRLNGQGPILLGKLREGLLFLGFLNSCFNLELFTGLR